MKHLFLAFADRGAMTKEDVARILNVRPELIRRMSKDGRLPRIPNIRAVRFCPLEMVRVFCEPPNETRLGRSLTIEVRPTFAENRKGFSKCL